MPRGADGRNGGSRLCAIGPQTTPRAGRGILVQLSRELWTRVDRERGQKGKTVKLKDTKTGGRDNRGNSPKWQILY